MAHIHHIIPQYRGGTDDLSNLIEVSVTRHAMFHFCNWQLWKDNRDLLAWKGLVGEISKEEMILSLRRLGGQKGGRVNGEKPETKARMSLLAHKNREKAVRASLSFEAKAKRIETLMRIKHSQGERNSQFGTMWVTNEKTNLKIAKNAPIPEGFRAGRVMKLGT